MTPAKSEEVVPEHGDSPGFRCEAGKAQTLVGQAASGELGARALELTGAQAIRWIQPGQMVTMDYRTDRLNIELDARNRVTAIRCG
jgi:hypothetical protein